ncbi:hypothetical protein [Brachyspira pulli]|uniref:hypothetical protein n=1 Tax=Brachyspira pulli TaxID=310721 RepID=UPI0030041F28
MIKDLLLKIWDKIKNYKIIIIMYVIMSFLGLILDIIFVNFNIMKCIVYVILFAAFIIFIIFNKVIIKKV